MTTPIRAVVRYGLVLIILWFGLLKFTAHEAEAIRPLVESSPLMRWAVPLVALRPLSAIIGIVELAIAALIALGPLSARLGAVGSALAVGLFVTTLSFLSTTPDIWEETRGGLPTPGPIAALLMKDVVLLGAAFSSLRESLGSLGQAPPLTLRPSSRTGLGTERLYPPGGRYLWTTHCPSYCWSRSASC